MSQICGWYGISRQSHYQMAWRRSEGQEQAVVVLELVQAIRQRHPRMGGRKLHHEVSPQLEALGIFMGRDRFFDLLAYYDLLVAPLRQRQRTTWPGNWRCPNHLIDLTIQQIHQVWVGDITYIQTENGFYYLALLTDAFSRCIVGYDLSASLVVLGAMRALKMATTQARSSLIGLIHHSDHGIQYTCHEYRDRLQSQQMVSSMGAVGNCYDNALAERVNGILKLEYGLGGVLRDLTHAQHLTDEAIWLYNHERPHLALNYQKPIQVHQNGLQQHS